MSQATDDDWVLGEAEALLEMDGRRERLERVAAALDNGTVEPVSHAAARERIEKRQSLLLTDSVSRRAW